MVGRPPSRVSRRRLPPSRSCSSPPARTRVVISSDMALSLIRNVLQPVGQVVENDEAQELLPQPEQDAPLFLDNLVMGRGLLFQVLDLAFELLDEGGDRRRAQRAVLVPASALPQFVKVGADVGAVRAVLRALRRVAFVREPGRFDPGPKVLDGGVRLWRVAPDPDNAFPRGT